MIAKCSLAPASIWTSIHTDCSWRGAHKRGSAGVPQAGSTLRGYRVQRAFIPANICFLWHNGVTDWKGFTLDQHIKLPLTSSHTQHVCDYSGNVWVASTLRIFCCTHDTCCATCALWFALPGTWVRGTPGCILNTSGHSCSSHSAACVWNGHIKLTDLILQHKYMVNLAACLNIWKFWGIPSSGMWFHILW